MFVIFVIGLKKNLLLHLSRLKRGNLKSWGQTLIKKMARRETKINFLFCSLESQSERNKKSASIHYTVLCFVNFDYSSVFYCVFGHFFILVGEFDKVTFRACLDWEKLLRE